MSETDINTNGNIEGEENYGEGTSTAQSNKNHNNQISSNIDELSELETLRKQIKEAQNEKARLLAALENQKEKTAALLQVNEVLLTKTDQLESKMSEYHKDNNRDKLEKDVEELKNKNVIIEYQMKDLKDLVSDLRDEIEKNRVLMPKAPEMMPSSSNYTCEYKQEEKDTEHFELTLCESYDKKYLQRAISKCNNNALLTETEDGTIKCYNVDWCVNNIELLLNTCLKIEMFKIPLIDVPKSLNISKDTDIISQTGTKLNFAENQKITIRGDSRVKMKNFEIINSNYGDTHLFILENSAFLQFNQGLIKCNIGNKSIFHLNPNTKLELNGVEMENNRVPNGNVSCITGSRQKEIKINNCKFYNHTSNDFPQSVKLIESSGDLNIMLSEFENNTVEDMDVPCISSHGPGIINIENSRFEKCCHLEFDKVSGLYIENSTFSRNGTGSQNGGALYITNSKNISIEDSILKGNVSCQYGGAIYLKSSNDMTFTNCVFEENSCKEGGRGGAISFENSPTYMINCTFGKNKSTYGGALEICSCVIKTVKCIFDGNDAVKAGGAVYSNGKDNFVSDSAIVMKSNTAEVNNDIHC